MFHRIEFIGNLGVDPELRYTNSGDAVTNMTVASTRRYTNKNGQVIKETIWFKVSAFRGLAENCVKYLHKGSKVFVEGRLTHTERGDPKLWQAQDGSTRASFEVVASDVRFLDPSGYSEGDNGGNGYYKDEPDLGAWGAKVKDTDDDDDEEYPF